MSWPVSAAFKAAVVKSHTPTFKVEIMDATGLLVASTDVLALVDDLTVLSGEVTEDRKVANGRHTARVELLDRTNALAPLLTTSPIYPMRDLDMRLYRGIDTELVPLATVQLESIQVMDEHGGVTMTFNGTDRSKAISGMDWRTELTIAEGTTPLAATQAILEQVDPSHTYVYSTSPTTKTLDEITFIPGESPNPWDAIVALWQGAAMEVYFDQVGQVRSKAIPDPLTSPIMWEFQDGQANIRVDPLSLSVDRASLRNGVKVQGSAPWLVYGVYGEAWDTDPSSTTYFDPDYPEDSLVGPHPEVIEDAMVSNETEATALAVAKLPDYLGIEEQVEFNTIPNPMLEAGDVVQIGTPLLGSPSRFILDQLTTPLLYSDVQRANTRRRRK